MGAVPQEGKASGRGSPQGTRDSPGGAGGDPAFKRKHPSLGAKRLSFMMLDRNVAAVSPSSVRSVLQEAGLSSQWTVPEGQKVHHKEMGDGVGL